MEFFKNILFFLVQNDLTSRLVSYISSLIVFRRDLCIHVRGFKIYANSADRILASLLWKYETLENSESQILMTSIEEGMTVIDIGANIGNHTLVMSRRVGKAGKVIAFEPDPENFRLLAKNIRENDLSNVIPVQKAVADRKGTARLYLNRGHRGDHRIFDRSKRRPWLKMETTTIDAFVGEERIGLIKMDIQGAEPVAIRGMRRTIANNPNLVLILEFSPFHLREGGTDPDSFLSELEASGFTIRVIEEKTGRLSARSKKDLLASCAGTRYRNLYLFRCPVADNPGGDTADDFMVPHICRHDRASRDNDPVADGHAS